MKADRKPKAAKSPSVSKAVKGGRRAAVKTNGKHPLSTYQHIPVGIVETSLEGKYVDVNEEFCRILGYSRNELLRLGIKDCTHEDDYGIDNKLHEQLVTGKIPFYKLEKRFVRKGGDIIWVELTRTLVCDENGGPLNTVGVVLDISERKDVESILRESVERLRLATQSARMFMWEWDLQTQVYTVDDNFEKVLGFSGGLLPKASIKSVQRLMPPEDRQILMEAVEKAIESHSDVHSLQFRFINPDNGEIAWLELNGKIIYNDKGNAERMFGVTQNITESKKNQDEIAIISMLPAQNPNPVMRITPDGHILYANPACAPLLEEWGQQVGREIPEKLQRVIIDVFDSGVKKEIEIRNQANYFSCTLAPIHEAGYINLYGKDITARKQAEEKLRESEERFRALVSQATAGIAQSDMEGRFTFINPRFCDMLGYSQEELLGKTIWELTYTDDLAENKHLFQRMLTRGESYQFEKRFLRKDGSKLWTNVSVSTIRDLDGNPMGGVGVIIDIEERKQAEAALTEFARQQEALYKLSDQLHRTESLEDVFDAALDAILSALQCDRASILLYDNSDVMHFVAWRGLSDEYRKATDGHSPWTPDVKDPEPICIEDVHTAELSEPLRATIRQEGISSLAFIPLVSDGRLIGKFMIYFNTPHPFDDVEIDLGLTIAHQLAFGIDRKRIEDALRLENERFMRFVNSNIVGILIGDARGEVIVANDYYLRLLGVSRREFLDGKVDWKQFTPPEWLEADEKAIRELRERGICEPYEKEYVRTDGTRVPVYIADALLPGPGGEIAAFVLDVTARKRAEEALRRNEQMFSTLLDAAPFGVYFIDSEFRLRAINKGSEAVFSGIHPLIGRDFAEVLRMVWQEPFATEAIEHFRHTLRTGESFISSPVVEQRANIEEIEAYDWQIHRITLSDGTFGVVCYFYDLSEQKQMEATVRASESLYRSIARSIPGGGVYVVDKDFRYLVAEGPVTEAFGLSREILEGRTVSEVFPDERGTRMEERLRRNFAGEIVSFETEHHGRVYWTQQAPLRDSIGQAIIVTMDITERKWAEEALRESEERFRAILRQATAGIVRKDAEGRLIFVNQAFCNMLGYTESELVGKTVWEFMHPDDVTENQQLYSRMMMEGIPLKLERRFIREDGSVIWVDASVSPILDATGKPQSAVAVEVDITGRKQAEDTLRDLNLQLENRVQQRTARLNDAIHTLRDEIAERRKVEASLRKSEAMARENEEKLRTLFELLPVGISFLDLNGQIIQMNSALANILKLSKEQLATQIYRSRIYVRPNGTLMSPAEFASQRALTEGRTVYNVETGVVLENNEVIWTSVSAAPVQVADVGAVVVTVDITESKLAERALQESGARLRILSQRLVEVQEDERRAIARELHDRVGQTLAALNINLIIISGQLAGKVDEQINTRLNDSMKLVAETISLVRDVMSNLRPAVLDDYGLESAIESYLSQYTSRYEIDARFERPNPPIPRLGPSIEMTFLRIAQEALMNIVRHASATQANLSLWQEGNTICMTVQDNGVGIASLQEANRPGSHGLTIMRERAEAFGGSLTVGSTPGQGTKVEVKIPVVSGDSSQAEKEMIQ